MHSLESLITQAQMPHNPKSQPDEELSPNPNAATMYSRTDLLHIGVASVKEPVCKQLHFDTMDADEIAHQNNFWHTSPFQDVCDKLDLLSNDLRERLYSESLKPPLVKGFQHKCPDEGDTDLHREHLELSLHSHKGAPTAEEKDKHQAEHDSLRSALIVKMFEVEDFILWKKRGYSDDEAHASVQSRFEYGHVIWMDGCLQFVDDIDDEHFSEDNT